SDASVFEGDSGTRNAVFTVTLSAVGVLPVTGVFATADGTATGPDDYLATSGVFSIQPGQTSRTISVPVRGDTLPEATETFLLNLSHVSNATVVRGQGIGRIFNDDFVFVPAFQNRSLTPVVNEGESATLTGTIVQPDPHAVFILEVNWGDGTPTETFTFPPGSDGTTVHVSHRYTDDNPSGTPADSYTVHVSSHDLP